MSAQRPPRLGAQRPARNVRTSTYPERGAPKHAQSGRREACPAECAEACPEWTRRELPRMGAQRPARNGRPARSTEANGVEGDCECNAMCPRAFLSNVHLDRDR